MQVAAAERQTQQDVLVPVTGNWMLTIEKSPLAEMLVELSITFQHPGPGSMTADLLFGTVNSTTMTDYGILGGQTNLVEVNGHMRQHVSFDLAIDGKVYQFRRGELVDALRIGGGIICKIPASGDREDAVEEGTWSAQASPGADPDDDRHKHGGRSKQGCD